MLVLTLLIKDGGKYRMYCKSTLELKRYRNTSNNSGCVTGNYNIINKGLETNHVEDRINEYSGEFISNHKQKKWQVLRVSLTP